MSYLQKFIKNKYRDGQAQRGASSFANLTEDQLETHLRIARYGSFMLTDAVRPSYDLQVVPGAGFRHDKYRDEATGVEIPVVMAAASRERIMDIFMEMLDHLGNEVDVILETSHECEHGGHDDLTREGMELPILKSILYDYEDLLLDDGCMGIAIVNPKIPVEVQFDEHKILIGYGKNLRSFENVFDDHGLVCTEDMKFITEAEHVHSSSEEFLRRFQNLKYDLGIDE